jgi:membrane protease YdiL (CAAX protease family)
MIDYNLQRPRFSASSQLGILMILFGFGYIMGGVVTIFVAQAMLHHVPLKDLGDALKSEQNAGLSRWLQFIGALFSMAIPAFVFARVMNNKPFDYIGFNGAISGKQVFLIIGIMFLALYVSEALATVNEMIPLPSQAEKYFRSLEDDYNKEVMAIANMKSPKDYLISLFIIAFLPAIFEEMLFRGTLQPIMISLSRNAFIGILLTSIFFSAVHLSYYGFLPRLALGIVIGYVFYYSKNLWLSSLTHFLYNAFGVTQMYELSRQGLLTPQAMNDNGVPLYYGLFAAVALFGIFILFKRECQVEISMYNFRKNKF